MNYPKLNLRQIYVVDWEDSTTSSGWEYLDTGSNVQGSVRQVRSVGFLAGFSDTVITLTASYALPRTPEGAEAHLCPLSIPRGCILSMVSGEKEPKIASRQ